jgi:hypothetical protein
MTTQGPCIVVERYADGDYAVRDPGNHEPQDVWSVRPSQLWTIDEYPDWVYDKDGNKETYAHLVDSKVRAKPLEEMPAATNVEAGSAGKEEVAAKKKRGRPKGSGQKGPSITTASPVATRTRAHRKAAFLVFDPGTMYTRGLHYPIPKVKYSAKSAYVVPKGMSLKLTEDELRKMQAVDVEDLLPRHHHQTIGHPLRTACANGEILELQDFVNREVFGQYQTDGAGAIGLMWVYAIKREEETGLYKRVRSRLTLMGNQNETSYPKRMRMPQWRRWLRGGC